MTCSWTKNETFTLFSILLLICILLIFCIFKQEVNVEVHIEEPECTHEEHVGTISETAGVGREIATQTIVPEWTSLGEFKLTAYCACEKCCGAWAYNRPIDESGDPIVYTADQSVAEQGVTVAADTDVLPFGTQIMINNHVYTVQDNGSAVDGNHIDIYFESHEEALQFGIQYAEIFTRGNV